MPVDDEDPEVPVNDAWRAVMREARLSQGLTQGQLGAKVGATQNMVSLLESGRQGGGSKVLAICRTLKIPPPYAPVVDDVHWKWIQVGAKLRSLLPDTLETILAMAEKFLDERTPSSPPPSKRASTALASKNR